MYVRKIDNKLIVYQVFIFIFFFRFKTHLAKEVIQETLVKYLKDREYSQIEAETLSKNIANEVKNKLKGYI